MSALSDRLYAEWLRRNGSGGTGVGPAPRWESRSDRLRREWLDDARELARQRREADRLRSARRRPGLSDDRPLGPSSSGAQSLISSTPKADALPHQLPRGAAELRQGG